MNVLGQSIGERKSKIIAEHESARRAPQGSRYVDQRHPVVSERLDDLRGPVGGVVELGQRFIWSGRTRYDVDDIRQLAGMYEIVLREATTCEDLHRWVNETMLVRLWPSLVIPPQVRIAWEAHHSRLKSASASRTTHDEA